MKATTKYGNVRAWDEGDFEGYGFYVYVESLGVVGVVRAQTWEDAWDCVIDEIMADADPDDPYTYARSYDDNADVGQLAEGVHIRSSGVPSNPGLSSHLAQEDLNGSRLDGPLTAEQVAERYEITIMEDYVPGIGSA